VPDVQIVCAFHLVGQVYQAFGFEERDLPVE
jgi:hypothetical protein